MERQSDNIMDIDRALARAMDADDPGPAFAGRVVAAVARDRGAAPARERASAPTGEGRSRAWRALLPIAATIALTAAGLQWRTARVEDGRAADGRVVGARAEEARARAAHAQLVQALRLTGEKLNVVHRAIERSQE
jgi:hypothetical protein